MALKLYNTLTNRIEEFTPLKPGTVRMYHCGPTVYDYAHIGNLRSFIFADLLRRTLELEGFKVKQVMNITDIGQLTSDADEGEDKMTKGLLREGKPVTLEAMRELADFYTKKFEEDLAKLNILKPHFMPRASEHLSEQVQMIETLENKGFTYRTSDGLYFDTSNDPEYGKLGMLGKELESRIGGNREKKNPRDFALWKFNEKMGFPSPWGQGFPGWHIECSAMSVKYLGQTFDIHTGGIDLAPIHHNNEIAQSENACGCPFVKYWLHNEFVNIDGEKMAKSEGNIFTLRTVAEKGFSPLAYRYLLLQSQYRSKVNFTWEALEAAQTAYKKLKEFFAANNGQGTINNSYIENFRNALEEDLNTPKALALVWQLVKDESLEDKDKKATLLEMDKVLGLDLENNEFALTDVPTEVDELLIERDAARIAQNWSKADVLRDQIRTLGYEVKDTPEGQKLSKI